MKYNLYIGRPSGPGEATQLFINNQATDIIQAIACLYEMLEELEHKDV